MALVTGTCNGGWRMKIDGDWVELPVLVDLVRNPPVGTSCEATLERASISATTTYDAEIEVYSELTGESTVLADEECAICSNGDALIPFIYNRVLARTYVRFQNAALVLFPNLTKQFTRMVSSGYGATIRRGGLPKVYHSAYQHCCKLYFSDCDEPATGCPGTISSYATKTSHLREEAKDRYVEQTPGELETWLSNATPCPYTFISYVDDLNNVEVTLDTPGLCPGGMEEGGSPDTCACFDPERYRIYRYLYGVYPNVDTDSNSTGNPDWLDHLYHAIAIARFVNSAGNPHYHYCYLTPTDSDPDYWKVDGTKVNVSDYFGKLREQHNTFRTLPLAHDKKTRNSVQAAPWLEGIHKTVLKSWFNTGETSWWGVSRFKAQDVSIPASVSLSSSSSSRWSASNCTPAFGATIVLTPSSANIALEFSLGSLTVTPYLYPLMFESVNLAWTVTNISAISWYLVNQQGDQTLLATTQGIHARPTAQDDDFAGSWAQDYGLGITDDTGVDTAVGGVSAATLANVETNTVFELLAGWTAQKLRVEITVANPALTVTLNYPTFYAPTSAATVLAETGQVCDALWALAPGLRYGQWDCWDSGGDILATVPAVRDPGEKTTALDWLIWSRLMYQAIASTSGLDTEINSLWDSVELGSFPVRKATKIYTISFLADGSTAIGGVGCMVNSYAEVPPLAIFPKKERDSDWQETGDWIQEACIFDVAPRYLINPTREMHMETPGGTQITTLTTLGPGAWKVTKHEEPVLGTEGDDYSIVASPEGEYATASPYHGYFAMLSPGDEDLGDNPFNLHSIYGQFMRIGLKDGLIHFWRAAHAAPPFELDVDVSSRTDCANPKMAMDGMGILFSVFEEFTGGIYTSYEAVSYDDGATWETEAAMAMANGRRPTINVNQTDTVLRCAFVYNSGSSGPGKIKGTLQHSGDASESAVFTFKDDAAADIVFADDSFHVSPSASIDMRWLLSCRIDGETDVSEWFSTDDGKTWTRIT